MGEGERRRALRVPVRGFAVLHGEHGPGPLHGSLENLSKTGALVSLASKPPDDVLDLELRLSEGDGWVTARPVRIERASSRGGWKLALVFDRVDPAMQSAIERAILHALAAAERRPVLVIDDHTTRRRALSQRLEREGMTPLEPRTPLEAIDLLARSQLHVSVCLLAPGFGVAPTELANSLSDSFPWVTPVEITDDLDATLASALAAWSSTALARLGTAIA